MAPLLPTPAPAHGYMRGFMVVSGEDMLYGLGTMLLHAAHAVLNDALPTNGRTDPCKETSLTEEGATGATGASGATGATGITEDIALLPDGQCIIHQQV